MNMSQTKESFVCAYYMIEHEHSGCNHQIMTTAVHLCSMYSEFRH